MAMLHRAPIWLIGGTQESAELARAIVHLQIPCIVSVTTDAARSLYPQAATLQVWVGTLNPEHATAWIQAHRIGGILDASHPFATAISALAITLAEQHHLPYLRYERPVAVVTQPMPAGLRYVDSYQTLLNNADLRGQRILLTIGYKNLALFQPWHDRAHLFARILPSRVALDAAIAAGFTSDRIIALRPPISAALERALWQQWQISMVVTKASGTAGGEDIKQQVAAELGVTLVVIPRPAIAYPQQTSDLQRAVAFCQAIQGDWAERSGDRCC